MGDDHHERKLDGRKGLFVLVASIQCVRSGTVTSAPYHVIYCLPPGDSVSNDSSVDKLAPIDVPNCKLYYPIRYTFKSTKSG